MVKYLTLGFALIFFGPVSVFAAELELAWSLKEGVKGPETVVYDADRDCLYVSSYDMSTPNEELGTDFVSKLSVEGEVLELKWLDGLSSPLGMEIHGDRLYIVERWGVNIIEISTRKSVQKIETPDAIFLNDISVDLDGTIYATDPGASTIFRIEGGKVSEWLSGAELGGVNGIMLDGSTLLIGTSGNAALKTIDINSKEIRVLAQFEGGIVDGIQKADTGYYVSIYHGELFLIEAGKDPIRLLDTQERKVNCANFLYHAESERFYIPELANDSISAYQIVK